jgi:hypothetical protein
MKKIIFAFIFATAAFSLYACPVCERAKARTAFGSITHGVGPTSNWDYVAVWIVVIAVLLSFFYSVKWLIKPAEKNTDHIKYSISNFE